MAELPTTEDLYNRATGNQNLPTVDDLYRQATQPSPEQKVTAITGSVGNYLMAPISRIGKAFGDSFSEHEGTTGSDPATDDALKRWGVYNDYQNGHTSIGRSINEAILRPIIAGGITANATFQAALAAAHQTGGELGATVAPDIQKTVPGTLGKILAAPFGVGGELTVGVTEGFLPEFHFVPKSVFQNVAKARAEGVLGEGEGGYFGTTPPTPEDVQARTAAVAETAPTTQPLDVHTLARQVAPETFQEYDTLGATRDQLRTQLTGLSETAPAAPRRIELQEQIDSILGKVSGDEDRLTVSQTERLRQAQSELETSPVKTDTSEMADLRAKLQDVDYRMRDLAPDVAYAYRTAAEQSGDLLEPSTASTEPVQGVSEGSGTTTPENSNASHEASTSLLQASVKESLIKAGRPEEEAEAASAIAQAYYTTRAGRLRTTSEALFAKDHPEVRAATSAEETASKGKTRGKIAIDEAKNTVLLFKSANASTFMHEMGHQFLENLRTDVKDPGVGPETALDSAIVHRWLKASEDEPLTRKQHEQFARGFERYLMEGRSPTKELAGVFQQFKNWLTKLYRIVSSLRPPITSDIRDVFARFLSEDPDYNGVTIAPEETGFPKDWGSRNVRLYHGGSNLDKGQSLWFTSHLKKAQGYAEKTTEGKVQFVDVPENHPLLSDFAEYPEQTHRQGYTIEKELPPEFTDRREILPSETGLPEGPGLSGPDPKPVQNSDTPVDETKVLKQPEGSSETLASKVTYDQSKYIAKDGRINFATITSEEDLQNFLKSFADKNNDFILARKGQLSIQDRLDMADLLGRSPRRTNANINKLSKLFVEDNISVSARAYALKEALKQNTRRAMEFVSSDDPLGYIDSMLMQQKLQQTFEGVRTEWGRIGQALQTEGRFASEEQQLTEFFQKSVGKSFEQVKREMAALKELDTEQAISKQLLDSANKASFGRMILEYTRMNYITGPITHMTYSIANKLFLGYKTVPETLVKAGITKLQEITSKEPVQRVYASEAWEGAKEMARQYSYFWGTRDGFKAAKASFIKGEIEPLPGEGSVYDLARSRVKNSVEFKGKSTDSSEFQAAVKESKQKFLDKFAVSQATAEGLEGEELARRIDELKNNYDESRTLQKPTSIWTKDKAIPGLLGKAVRSPGERFVGPIHAFDRTVGFEVHRTQMITRMALDEGLRGQDLFARVAELKADTPDEILAKSRDEAWEDALMGFSGDFTRRYQALLNYAPNIPLLGETPLFGFIEPFVAIPAQIAKTALYDRGPLGLFSKRIWSDLLGKNGSMAQADTGAKMSLGLGVTVGMASLNWEGLANEGADKDWKKAAVDKMYKGLPHSVRIGDMTFAFDRLGVLGQMMSLGTDLGATTRISKDGDLGKAGMFFLYSMKENTKEMFEGFSDLFKAADNPETDGARWAKNFATTAAVPGAIGLQQIAGRVDPYMREARTWLDTIKSKIPFLSGTLEPKIDIFGNPVPNKEFYGVYAQQVHDDPVVNNMERLGVFPAPVAKKIRGVELSAEQYHDFAVQSGVFLRQGLQMVMSLPGWADQKPALQIKLVQDAVKQSRERAANLVMAKSHFQPTPENPDIMMQAIENKTNLLSGAAQ